jgi:DNA-binding NtrC family response regulator
MDAHKRVLFVDDEEGVRKSWDRYLSLAGFDVTTAADGETAIDRLNEEPVDVVVSDLKMPGMDGVKLLEWIHEAKPNTQFILLTGYGNDEIERKVRSLGAFDYLNKPISPETLSGVVTAASILAREKPALAPPEPERREEVDFARAVEPTAVEEEQARQVAPAETPKAKSPLRRSVEVIGGLVLAPIVGLAFVVFLPIVGFGALLWSVGEKGWEMVKSAPEGMES